MKTYGPALLRLALIFAFANAYHYWRAGSFSELVDDFTVYFMITLAGAIGMTLFGDAEQRQDERDLVRELKKAVQTWRSRPATDRQLLTPPSGNVKLTDALTKRIDNEMTKRLREERQREQRPLRPPLRVVGTHPAQNSFPARRDDQTAPGGDFRVPFAVVPMGFLPKMDMHAIGRFTDPPRVS